MHETANGSILLHICCAPCATYPVLRLRELGYSVTGYWYNPNIHPWQEHEARRKSLLGYGEQTGLPLIVEPGYDIVRFMQEIVGRERHGDRCAVCYNMRLNAAAACASRLSIPLITTTLLISPYQDQNLIREIGEAAATRHGVEFYFENFRRGWSERGRLTRKYGLYRQQYCGCLYSEFERYTNKDILEAVAFSYEDV